MTELDIEKRKDGRFFVTLSMGFILLIIGVICPPVGEISRSILYGSAMLLILSGGIVGLDVPSILHEIRLLRQDIITDNKVIKEEEKVSEIEEK